MDRNVEILVLLCVVDLFSRTYHLDDRTNCILYSSLALCFIKGIFLIHVALLFVRSGDCRVVAKVKSLHTAHIYRHAGIRCVL